MYSKLKYFNYKNLYNDDLRNKLRYDIDDYKLEGYNNYDYFNDDDKMIIDYKNKDYKNRCIDKIFETFENNDKYTSLMDLYCFIYRNLSEEMYYLDIIIEKYTDRLIKIMKNRNIKIEINSIEDIYGNLYFKYSIFKYFDIFKEFLIVPINLYELSRYQLFLWYIIETGIIEKKYISECKYIIENSNELDIFSFDKLYSNFNIDIKYIINTLLDNSENELSELLCKKLILDSENKISLYDEIEKCKNYKGLNNNKLISLYINNKYMYLYTLEIKYLKDIINYIKDNDN